MNLVIAKGKKLQDAHRAMVGKSPTEHESANGASDLEKISAQSQVRLDHYLSNINNRLGQTQYLAGAI